MEEVFLMIMPEGRMVLKSINVVDAGHDRNSVDKHRSPNSTHNKSEVVADCKWKPSMLACRIWRFPVRSNPIVLPRVKSTR